jgi:predicted nucleotidyltransferase
MTTVHTVSQRVSNATATAEPDWDAIVATIHRAVGPVPVMLAGSRAIGTADSTSDYDLVAVMPLARIPRALGRLREARSELEHVLDAPVSLNPLPTFQVHRSATNLFVWKLWTEGRLLSVPDGFAVERPPMFRITAGSAYSYLMTAVFLLLEGSDSPNPIESWDHPSVARSVDKALLHLVQLRLLRRGRYAATLDQAIDISHDPAIAGLVSEAKDPRSWFTIRSLLLSELTSLRPERTLASTILRNVQYASLSQMRGNRRWPAVIRGRSSEHELGEAAIALLQAVESGGGIDVTALAQAADSLPGWLHAPREDWRGLRALLRAEWASAHALAGL